MLDLLIFKLMCRSVSASQASGESSFPYLFLLEISMLIPNISIRFFQALPLGTEKRNTVGDMTVKMGVKR